MTLFNTFQTSISGMNAQAKRIETVSENIANINTTGYKRAHVEFETALIQKQATSYTSGGVNSHFRYELNEQAGLLSSSQSTNMAIQGHGFFIVKDGSGAIKLTRAGAFVPDASGSLVNTAGFRLTGYKIDPKGQVQTPTNSSDLETISINRSLLAPVPTRNATMTANLGASAERIDVVHLPSTNSMQSEFSATTSLQIYDNLGQTVNLDIYYAKVSDNSWEVSVYDARTRSSARFPYTSGPLITQQLRFDDADGSLATPGTVVFQVPGGQQIDLDLGRTTQFGGDFSISESKADGSPARSGTHVQVDNSGRLSILSDDGYEVSAYQIALGNVVSPDKLSIDEGNAFTVSPSSGALSIHLPDTNGVGRIYSSMLEGSAVDLGSELASIIESQRNYTANTKVFKTAGEMLEVLMSLRN